MCDAWTYTRTRLIYAKTQRLRPAVVARQQYLTLVTDALRHAALPRHIGGVYDVVLIHDWYFSVIDDRY